MKLLFNVELEISCQVVSNTQTQYIYIYSNVQYHEAYNTVIYPLAY